MTIEVISATESFRKWSENINKSFDVSIGQFHVTNKTYTDLTLTVTGGRIRKISGPVSVAQATITFPAVSVNYLGVDLVSETIVFHDQGAVIPSSFRHLYTVNVGPTTIQTVQDVRTVDFMSDTSGTVTSVAISVPTGLSVAGSPITTSGTFTITFAAGYSIPTDASQTNWDTAFGWGNHASVGYLTTVNLATNVTGTLPVANGGTGITALGTGVQTALGVAVTGSGGAVLATGGSVSALTLNDGYTEEVFAATTTTPALSPVNGSIQTWTLTGNSTPTAGTWADGQSMTLMIDDGTAYTVTWTSLAVTWKTDAGVAPTLNATGYTAIQLWKVGTVIYGARVGDA